MDKKTKKYEEKILVEVENKTTEEGMAEVGEMMKMLGLKVESIKPVVSLRTLRQNNALHKWCEMMAQELKEKHIDKREFFKESFFTQWTTIGVKNEIWRPIQMSLTGKKSTTKLDRAQEIDLIWDNINRIIIDKFKGEVMCPLFPSYENYEN